MKYRQLFFAVCIVALCCSSCEKMQDTALVDVDEFESALSSEQEERTAAEESADMIPSDREIGPEDVASTKHEDDAVEEKGPPIGMPTIFSDMRPILSSELKRTPESEDSQEPSENASLQEGILYFPIPENFAAQNAASVAEAASGGTQDEGLISQESSSNVGVQEGSLKVVMPENFAAQNVAPVAEEGSGELQDENLISKVSLNKEGGQQGYLKVVMPENFAAQNVAPVADEESGEVQGGSLISRVSLSTEGGQQGDLTFMAPEKVGAKGSIGHYYKTLRSLTVEKYDDAEQLLSKVLYTFHYGKNHTTLMVDVLEGEFQGGWMRHEFHFRDGRDELWFVNTNPYLKSASGEKEYVKYLESLDSASAKDVVWDLSMSFEYSTVQDVQRILIKKEGIPHAQYLISDLDYAADGKASLEEYAWDNYRNGFTIPEGEKLYGKAVVRQSWGPPEEDSNTEPAGMFDASYNQSSGSQERTWISDPAGSLDYFLVGPEMQMARPFFYVIGGMPYVNRPSNTLSLHLRYSEDLSSSQPGAMPALRELLEGAKDYRCEGNGTIFPMELWNNTITYKNFLQGEEPAASTFRQDFNCGCLKSSDGKTKTEVFDTEKTFYQIQARLDQNDQTVLEEKLIDQKTKMTREVHRFEYGATSEVPRLPPPALSIPELLPQTSVFFVHKVGQLIGADGTGLMPLY